MQKTWTFDEAIEAMRNGTPMDDNDIVNMKTTVDGETGYSSTTVKFFKLLLMQQPQGEA